MSIWIFFIGFMILSLIVSLTLKSKFKKYSKILLDNGMSGRDVAERMLRDNGITDVKVECVQGQLTDHYNPVNKTINLSEEVYNGRSISSAAVAAHECGHAVQHANAYVWLGFRSKLVPVEVIRRSGLPGYYLQEYCLYRGSPAFCWQGLFSLHLQPFSASSRYRLRSTRVSALSHGFPTRVLHHTRIRIWPRMPLSGLLILM